MMSSRLSGLASSLAPLSKKAVTVSSKMMMMGSGESIMHGGGHGGFTATFGEDTKPPPQTVLPTWFFIFCLCIAVVSFPVFLYVSYTLSKVMPVLAMIEDPAPPAFEPLPTSDDHDAEADMAVFPEKPAMVTASILRTSRLLRSQGGIRSYFRGFWCGVVTFAVMSIVHRFFGAFIPSAVLYAVLTPVPAVFITLPLTTAWVHIIMSAPRPKTSWYRRIPPMAKTLSAMWRPALVLSATVALSTVVPYAMLFVLDLPSDLVVEEPNWSTLCWKLAVDMFVSLFVTLAVFIPAYVVFTRVQASLLPLEDEPIITFDRSFAGTIPPEVVSARGYVTMTDAWRTFPKDAWARLIRLYIKVVAICLTFGLLLASVIVPVYMVARRHATVTPAAGS